MNAMNPLAAATRAIVANARASAPRPDLQRVARDALQLTENIVASFPQFEVEATERNHVALALLLASVDQARSLCYLLAMEPQNGWYAALILHRSQFEHFLRGAFFARAASDAELSHFLRKNKLPSRTPDGQTKRALSVNELATIVVDAYGWESNKLQNTIRNNWGPLSGIVHGGRELLNAYITDEGIGADIDPSQLIEIVVNTVATAHMVIGVLMDMSPLSLEDQQTIVMPIHEEFKSFRRAVAP